MLQLGLRQALQAGYKSLTALDTTGCASDHQTELLKSVYHLLQVSAFFELFLLELKVCRREQVETFF